MKGYGSEKSREEYFALYHGGYGRVRFILIPPREQNGKTARAGFLVRGSSYFPRLPTLYLHGQWHIAGFVLTYSGGTTADSNGVSLLSLSAPAQYRFDYITGAF